MNCVWDKRKRRRKEDKMLDDDLFELDEDLLNATDFSRKFDETGK